MRGAEGSVSSQHQLAPRNDSLISGSNNSGGISGSTSSSSGTSSSGDSSSSGSSNGLRRAAELRMATVLFVSLLPGGGSDYSNCDSDSDGINNSSSSVGAGSSEADVLATLQKAIVTTQQQLYLFEGCLRQFVMDDKGVTLILVRASV